MSRLWLLGMVLTALAAGAAPAQGKKSDKKEGPKVLVAVPL